MAPVFLLTAIGTFLSVLSSRLGRIVDRARVLSATFHDMPEDRRNQVRDESGLLRRRRQYVDVAITCGVVSALLVCVLIGAAFLGYLVKVDLSIALAVLFIAAMGGFVVALVFFLREILISVTSLGMEIR